MSSPFSFPQPSDLSGALGLFVGEINQQIARARRTPEQVFRDLDVQPGDRIRLTRVSPAPNPSRLALKDASTLEGVVTKVRQKKGVSRVQIAGFDTAGNGVFWPVTDYKVEVLHRAYRFTDEDRVLAAVLGYSEHSWKIMTEDSRETLRRMHGDRVARVKLALGLEDSQDGVE